MNSVINVIINPEPKQTTYCALCFLVFRLILFNCFAHIVFIHKQIHRYVGSLTLHPLLPPPTPPYDLIPPPPPPWYLYCLRGWSLCTVCTYGLLLPLTMTFQNSPIMVLYHTVLVHDPMPLWIADHWPMIMTSHSSLIMVLYHIHWWLQASMDSWPCIVTMTSHNFPIMI